MWRTRWRSLRRGAARTVAAWSALFPYFPPQKLFGMVLLHNLAQVEVICEAREDWWNALLRSSQGVCDVLQRLLDFTNYLIHLVDCHLSYKPDQECSKTLLANQLAWLRSMTSPTLTSWASPIRPSRWSSSWTSSPSPRSYSPSLPPSATVLVASIPRWRRCWQGQRGFALEGRGRLAEVVVGKKIYGTVNDWIHSRVAVSVSAEVQVVLFESTAARRDWIGAIDCRLVLT